ncbi:MAG: HEPN domain-containing protein [Candidatus Coatesbacteria bacterium]|nr:HEPN domain-containing protein [Candidatus Coatesbacteria bacterium]
MLSRREIKEAYQKCLKEYSVRKQDSEKKFVNNYLEKAMHNLELAGVLDLLSRDEEAKKAIGISSKSNYYDWIIITSYYSMYLAATTALAKIGIKSTTHGATIIALEYHYCIEKNLLARKYIQMIEEASFGREDVEKLDQAMKGRISVQYTVSKSYGDNEAKRMLKDAKEFVNKISEIIT